MLHSLFGRNKKENKALLEHKLYLAREAPEPIFDISECDISCVPSGIYSLCRVFRKEHLNLSHNLLHSLNGGGSLADLCQLSVLNISNNAFTVLPTEIQLLVNLKEFYIENNLLIMLPFTICELKNLQVLHVNNNDLRELPENMGRLSQLKSLNVQGNSKLKRLPKTLHQANHLIDFKLDIDAFEYPPKNIIQVGVNEILKYLCEENECDCYMTKVVDYGNLSEMTILEENPSAQLEAKMLDLAKKKEEKTKEFLRIERKWEELRQKELEAVNMQRNNKEKLLADIVTQQEILEGSLNKMQQTRDIERFNLIEKLRESENAASLATEKLLQFSSKDAAQFLQVEIQEQVTLLAKTDESRNLKKAKILEDMRQLLEQETERFKKLDETRIMDARSIVEMEALNNFNVLQVLKTQHIGNRKLTEELRRDDEMQKLAVASLLEKIDVRCWSLIQQVGIVESQLAVLTNIELEKRKLKLNENLNALSQQRVELSALLMDLVGQRNERRVQLMSALQSLEEKNEKQSEDFWMRQYQALLDGMPAGLSEMQKNIDPTLVELLLFYGVFSYIPFLAKCHQRGDEITVLGDSDLRDLGITNASDRKNILSALLAYERNKKCVPSQEMPSAPEMDSVASAPLLPPDEHPKPNFGVAEVECVICMDDNCEVIYIPCGHYCCCLKCSVTISDCPMCRAKIERIIPIHSI